MSRVLSGTPVPRHQVFVLDDGDPVVQWSETRVQEIYSGRVRVFDYSQFGHPVTDHELNHLKSLGLVEHFTRQYVWVFALPEQSQFLGLRTIDGASGRSRVFYLNTTLPETDLDKVIQILDEAHESEAFTACAHEGIVAVLGFDRAAYANVGEAEAAQRTLTGLSPLFENSVVAFVERPFERHVVEEAETIDLETLIASQSATPVTAGKRAIVVCGDAEERLKIETALNAMQIDVQNATNGADALCLLEDCATDTRLPDVLVMDVHLDDMHGWEMLSRMHEIHALDAMRVIALADADSGDTSDDAAPDNDDSTMALTVAGVQVYLSRPLNVALLRQRVYEMLMKRTDG